jgi:LacI family transcriptional regulator
MKRSQRNVPRVALLIETSNAYGRGLLGGIAEYVQAHRPWSIYLPEMGRADEAAVRRLRGWRGDGILVRAESPSLARAVRSASRAVVDLSAAGLLPGTAVVHSDVRLEAKLAFEHLWERGFRHLGFCGVSDYRWVRWQEDRFCELASAAGTKVSTYVKPLRLMRARGWTADRNALAAWLAKLPKPLGIFACYDLRGQQVLEACRSLGLRIPDEVAVIGVDDDVVRCSLSDPPLSSVAPNTRLVGYLAAETLAGMMAGKKVEASMRLVPPLGVSARRSTDSIALPDKDVSDALRFIRDHCCETITVESVLQRVPLSRRSFEARFLRLVGRTPHAEILRCRLEQARRLLSNTDLPIKTIARDVGAATPEYLSVLFRRMLNTTPSGYRESLQLPLIHPREM